ncbi:hypothetical protein [Rathayibacter sp. Leaf248]|uniref:hypothetical protein n=1 Tax=Rathayibacter sp. Leaf248 TaxID=2876555 RepID=UPI001E387ECE|nr:hypothetical protein [Rathayibacter sp. Leaf248]
MSSSDNDIEPTLVDPEQIPSPTEPETGDGTTAGLDEVGRPSPDGLTQDGDAENPPLPDWGPTDGVHGTDADPDGTAGATR